MFVHDGCWSRLGTCAPFSRMLIKMELKRRSNLFLNYADYLAVKWNLRYYWYYTNDENENIIWLVDPHFFSSRVLLFQCFFFFSLEKLQFIMKLKITLLYYKCWINLEFFLNRKYRFCYLNVIFFISYFLSSTSVYFSNY